MVFSLVVSVSTIIKVDSLLSAGFVGKEARLSSVDSGPGDIQYRRPLHGGARSTPTELGPPYQEGSAL